MSTLDKMCTDCRLLLLEPRPQKPPRHLVLMELLHAFQSGFNQLSNTGNPWATEVLNLTTVDGQEDYLLPVSSRFGKPLNVWTSDPNNPSHFERSIDFFEPQDLQFDWNLPNDIANAFTSWDGSNHTALRIAIFRHGFLENGTIKARIKPIPRDQSEYKIMYSIGDWATQANVTDSPILSEHHHLFATRACQALLPGTEWWDTDKEGEKLNQARRNNLAKAFEQKLEWYLSDWKTYITNMNQEHITFAPMIEI